MKTSLKFLAILLLVINFSFGQSKAEKINAIVKESYLSNPAVSVSVGFIADNEEYYAAYGKINKESTVDVNKNSIFEVASITKILTANLIAQAVLENKIQLKDYIENHLPKTYVLQKQHRNKIRISDLASHQSGLTDIDFRELIAANPQYPMEGVTEQTFIDIVNNCSELIDYGKYRYSTIGYMLLGKILEHTYGKSYDEIIREKIIEPLQLTNTLTKDFNVKNITTGYNRKGYAQPFFKWQAGESAGLIKSSASDMITYLKAMLDSTTKIAKAGVITEKIFYKEKDGLRKLGLGTNIYIDGEKIYYLKTGDSMGQSSVICYNRIENWGIIILVNQQNPKMRKQLLYKILDTVLK